jgi:AAHS family 4-hydroxybenzoate transporter-like MFS transporter
VDIREVIDNGPFTRLQLRAVSLCFFLNVLDGVDVASISFAAPLLSRAWGIEPATLGVVFSAALAGMMAGSMLLAPFGDAIGRRKLLTLSLALIATGMLGVVLAHTLTELLALRFITGLGLGGVVPTMATFAAELSPQKSRNFAVTAVSSGYSLGAALWMVPHWGWPSLFLLGGGLTVVTLPLVLLYLPESLEFLLSKQPPRALERVNTTLRALRQPEITALPRKAEGDTRPRLEQVAAGLAALFAPRYARATLLLWLAFVTSLLTLYFLQNWVPQLTANAGLPTALAFLSGTVLNLGLWIGNASVGWFADRVGLRRSIATYLTLGAIVLLCFSYLQGTAAILIGLGTVGVMQGGFLGLYAVGARIYPATNRVTGIGWAAGVGRLGAVLGPYIAGLLVARGLGMTSTFIVFALPLAIAAIAVTAMRAPELGAPARFSAARTRASAARGT